MSVDSLASLSAWRPLPSEEERTSRAVPVNGNHDVARGHVAHLGFVTQAAHSLPAGAAAASLCARHRFELRELESAEETKPCRARGR